MATPTRIYHVALEGVRYLVRAAHPSAALMHVVRNVSAVRVASQDDLIGCIADGIKVENAKEEAETAPAATPAPAEEKSLPLWPMPTPASYTPPEVDEDPEDEDDVIAPGVAVPRQRMAIKYRCPNTGSTWSGRGVMPAWLRAGLNNTGKKLDDFLVKPAAPTDAATDQSTPVGVIK